MADDVMELLDGWIAALGGHPAAWAGVSAEQVKRIRDEIVALRGYRVECERQFQAKVAEIGGLLDRAHQARDEALEEAAQVADGYCTDRTDDVARGIRGLKGKSDE